MDTDPSCRTSRFPSVTASRLLMQDINYIRLNDEWTKRISSAWSRPFDASLSKGTIEMAFFSSEHIAVPGTSRFLSLLSANFAHIVGAWRLYNAERMLASLSYDTMKDIGFPSADMATITANDKTSAR